VFAVGSALLLRAFVVEAFEIPSGSMLPTLEIGDHVLVSKVSYGLALPFTSKRLFDVGPPRRGDVIVFRQPQDREVDLIKRVIALPGERVEVRAHQLLVDGRPVVRQRQPNRCYQDAAARDQDANVGGDCEVWSEDLGGRLHLVRQLTGANPGEFGPVLVSPGTVFVMGDNRDNSTDSRVLGSVPLHLIKGRALVVWRSRWRRPLYLFL
jgi:signal peptidase I